MVKQTMLPLITGNINLVCKNHAQISFYGWKNSNITMEEE